MMMTAKKVHQKIGPTLHDLAVGESGILGDFDLPTSIAEHLMNLGFVPGLEVYVSRSGPGGNPRVYRVDGTDVALRRDLSCRIPVRPCTQQRRGSR